MKHNKDQVITIAKKAFEQLDFNYDSSAEVYTDVNVYSYQNLSKTIWTIGLDFRNDEAKTGISTAFMKIDDETGNPISLQSHFNAVMQLEVRQDGTVGYK